MADTADKSNSFDAGREYLATVYAKALIGVTQQSNTTGEAMAELSSLVDDVFSKLPAFEATLASPRVPIADKEQMLDKVFAGKLSTNVLNFLKVLARHGRLDCLRAIRNAFQRLYNTIRGHVIVEITTATPVSSDLLPVIAEKLRASTGKEVDLHAKVDPEMLGGLVVRIGDTVYDGSVRNQLTQMREQALDQTLQALRETSDRFVVAS